MTGTRPKLSWSDLPGARVGVWGLGREGLANVRKLRAMGVEPVLVDDRPQAVAIIGMPSEISLESRHGFAATAG